MTRGWDKSGKAHVLKDGWIVIAGFRTSQQVVRLPHNRRWVLVDGTEVSSESWRTREQLLDDTFGFGNWD